MDIKADAGAAVDAGQAGLLLESVLNDGHILQAHPPRQEQLFDFLNIRVLPQGAHGQLPGLVGHPAAGQIQIGRRQGLGNLLEGKIVGVQLDGIDGHLNLPLQATLNGHIGNPLQPLQAGSDHIVGDLP